MKILIVGKFGNYKVVHTSLLPRVGDKVDLFYKPYPVVCNVLLYPSTETLKSFGVNESFDAIVTVD